MLPSLSVILRKSHGQINLVPDECTRLRCSHIVKILSDIFSLIREIEEDGKEEEDKWIAPTSLERVTTKYWVKEEDLPEVLLKSAIELPVLVYGKSGLLTKNPKDPHDGKDEFWKSLASPISSVYFDSENMDLYKERIMRSEVFGGTGRNQIRTKLSFFS